MDNVYCDSNYYCNTPPRTTRYTEKTFFWEKHYITVKQSTYTSEMINGHCEITEQLTQAQRVCYRPRISFFILCFFIICIILLYNRSISLTEYDKKSSSLLEVNNNSSDNTSISKKAESSTTSFPSVVLSNEVDALNYIVNTSILTNGMVFADSSSEEISDSCLDNILLNYPSKVSTLLIRMGINEIYARHGYVFSKPLWINYYCNLSWYNANLQKNVDFSSFNNIELQNINKLLSLEEEINNIEQY